VVGRLAVAMAPGALVPMTAVRSDSGAPSTLDRRALGLVILVAAVGYLVEWILRPVVPLIVLDRGGDATLVGIVTAAYALPALIFRQAIGSTVDGGRGLPIARLGSMAMAIGSVGLLLPGTIVLAVVRFVHGLGWSFVSVASQTTTMRLAPLRRRAEVSGYFATVPALGALVGPAVGVTLYTSAGTIAPALIAVVLAAIVLGLTIAAPGTVGGSRAAHRAERSSAGAATDPTEVAMPRSRSVGGLARLVVEPAAIGPMAMTACMMSAQALFFVFAPVFAQREGLEASQLAWYYVFVGVAFVVFQAIGGPIADRLGHGRSIATAAAFGVVGLLLATTARDLTTLAFAGAIYVAGSSVFNTTAMALTADLAPARRLGSAVATYSIGYQIGGSGSAIVWGPLIDRFGYPAPYVIGIVLIGLVLVIGRGLAGAQGGAP
jgi:MFS family permease